MKADQRTALLALIESIREVGASHQYDNEQGVHWLNEAASTEWAVQNKHYLAAAKTMYMYADRVEALFELEELR
jgi:hypothetical protein